MKTYNDLEGKEKKIYDIILKVLDAADAAKRDNNIIKSAAATIIGDVVNDIFVAVKKILLETEE